MQTKKILVIEDDDLVKEIIVNMLAYCGYQIESASNGKEAINILNDTKTDLVVGPLRQPDGQPDGAAPAGGGLDGGQAEC